MSCRKFFCIMVTLMCFATFFGMGNKAKVDEAGRSIITVKGNIVVFGNEPHTWLGFKTEDNKIYNIVADKATYSELQKKWQGLLIEITGAYEYEPESSMVDGTIYVHSVKAAK